MSSAKKRVIVSACLLGEYCRYDGKTKKVPQVLDKLEGCEIIPFCPEAPLFGTPRERINVVEENGEYRIKTQSGVDVTQLLEKEIQAFIESHPKVDALVLKSKSPSCGNQTTPILDIYGNQIGLGDGIATKMFKRSYKETALDDEVSLLKE